MRSFKVIIEMLEPMFSRWREWRLGKIVKMVLVSEGTEICSSDNACRYKPNEDIDAIGLRPWIH